MTSELKLCEWCGSATPCSDGACPLKRNTRAVPDVPELVTVGHLWQYAEYYRDDRGDYGYVKVITEENPSRHVSPASKIRHHRELVTRDQAAEIIAADRAEKHRAQEAVLKLERELAQYEAQVPVAWVDENGMAAFTLGGISTVHTQFETSKSERFCFPLYASPAPAADMKEKSRHD